MTDASADQQISLKLELNDEDVADQVEDWLRERSVSGFSRGTQHGILPILPIVIGATLAVSTTALLAVWIHDKFQCELTIDARGEDLRKEVDCSRRTGNIIILTKDGVKVEIVEPTSPIDLTEVMKAAVSGGGSEVKQAAEATGGKVETSPA